MQNKLWGEAGNIHLSFSNYSSKTTSNFLKYFSGLACMIALIRELLRLAKNIRYISITRKITNAFIFPSTI